MKQLYLLLLVPLLWICLSDFAVSLDKSSVPFMRGSSNNRLSTAISLGKSRDIVIIVGNTDNDRILYKSLVRELLANGFSTCAFDYRGRGRSWGFTPFKDELKIQLDVDDLYSIYQNLLATNQFTKDNIYFLCDSQGAKVLLRLIETYSVDAKGFCFFNYQLSSSETEKLDHLSNQIKSISPSSFSSSFAILLPTNIQNILSTLLAMNDYPSSYKATIYPYLRIFALFFTLSILILFPLFSILLNIIKKFKTQKYLISFSQKDFIQGLLLILQSGIALTISTLIFHFILKLKTPIKIGIPTYFLPAALYYIFFSTPKYLLYKIAPTKLGFKEILNFKKSEKQHLPNHTILRHSFESSVLYAFTFLVVLILTFRSGIHYIIPFNARQFWFLGLMFFIFFSFYIDAIENIYFNNRPIQLALFSIARYTLLFVALILTKRYLLLYLFVLVTLIETLMRNKKVKPFHIAFFQALIISIVGVPLGPLVI